MAKKPRFYPIIPRVKLGKTKRNTENSPNSSKPVLVHRSTFFDRYVKSTGQYIPGTLSESDGVIGYDEKAGIKNPGWRQTIAKGGDATSTYSRIRIIYKPTKYTCFFEDSGNLSLGRGQEDGGLNLVEKPWQPLIDRATASIKHKLDGNIGKAQLAAPLAESREIHRLVRQINTLGIDTVKAMLAIKKTRGKSAFKQFGNIWLGFGFGVNPMLKDIESAANSILDYNTREDRHVRLTGTASQDYFTSITVLGSSNIAYALKLGQKSQFYHTQGVHIVAGIDLKLRSAASYSVTDHLGLEVGALPGTLWELTPFSWVGDYFATVGPWLDDMFYTLPGATKYISMSTKYHNIGTMLPYPIPQVGNSRSGVNGQGSSRYSSFTRVPLTALPSRQLRIKSADEVAQHSLAKLLNLASVLAQKWGPNLGERLHPGFKLPGYHL